MRLDKSAIRSAISVALAGVRSGLPSISLYKALLIFNRISERIRFATSNDPAALTGCSPAEFGALGITVPGTRLIVSGLITPSSSI